MIIAPLTGQAILFLARYQSGPGGGNSRCTHEEHVNEARDFFKLQLGLAEPTDPVGSLHRAVSTSGVIVRTPDGEPCMALFNSFTIEDNPLLRGLADGV
jgi:hypothetical protein